MFVMWVGQTLDAHRVPTAQLGSAFWRRRWPSRTAELAVSSKARDWIEIQTRI